MLQSRSLVAVSLLISASVVVAACGSSSDETNSAAAGGAAGSGGGVAGSAGNKGGTAGASAGQGGKAGSTTGGTSGSSGQAGKAGAGQGGSAGQGGGTTGGAAGTGGASGASGGSAGSTGAACKADGDCALPMTVPVGCAKASCDPTSKKCVFEALDKDGDGHKASQCVATNGATIVVGDDCDDNAKAIYPGAWDGPKGDGNIDQCDGIDQNCSGAPDEQKLKDGTSCSCSPSDVQTCSTDAGGKPIAYPSLDAAGKPLGKCKLGQRTCGSDGKWGPCVGAIPPDPFEICNGKIDDDCDGKADMLDDVKPTNTVLWSYDEDGDGFVAKVDPKKEQSCPDTPPTTCATCKPAAWRLGNFPVGDCDDTNADAHPGATELCNSVDDDCNGTVDDGYATDASLWVFDWDGDGFGDKTIQPVRSCLAPTTLPAACATFQASVPAGYCSPTQPEDPPVCPAADCATSMWKKNLPNTDCKDRPDQGLTGTLKGNDPSRVYPGSSDLCNGKDFDCDGAANTGCPCVIGQTQPCGSTDTCNAGTQTCQPGGVWGQCSGGIDKPKFEFCPDGDSDNYCDLSQCQPNLCAADAPAGWKARSLCLPGGANLGQDCQDADPLVNPGNSKEVCNGDGKDYDCDGKVNTPGMGDCECISGSTAACAPVGFNYPAGKSPGDPLDGLCQWGSKTCNSDGVWSACGGGVGKTDQELCNGNGLDYNCNGVVNTVPAECSCTVGQTRACNCDGLETCSINPSTGQAAWGGCVGGKVIGSDCPVGNQVGACSLGGTWTCNANTSVCVAKPLIATNNCDVAKAQPSNSNDWNCSGDVQYCEPRVTGTYTFPGASSFKCSAPPANPTAYCAGLAMNVCGVKDFPASYINFPSCTPYCGTNVTEVNCKWDANTSSCKLVVTPFASCNMFGVICYADGTRQFDLGCY